MFGAIIDKAIDSGAKMARLMFNSGKDGLTLEQALELALKGVPEGPHAAKLKLALRHYFKG